MNPIIHLSFLDILVLLIASHVIYMGGHRKAQNNPSFYRLLTNLWFLFLILALCASLLSPLFKPAFQ